MTHKLGDLVRPVSERDGIWYVTEVASNGTRIEAVKRAEDLEPGEEYRRAWGNGDRFVSVKAEETKS